MLAGVVHTNVISTSRLPSGPLQAQDFSWKQSRVPYGYSVLAAAESQELSR
jgi:hypothetical protein